MRISDWSSDVCSSDLIRLRIEAVELRRADQAVEQRRALAAFVGACEEVVLSPQRDCPDRSLRSIVVDLDPNVVDLARQCRSEECRAGKRFVNTVRLGGAQIQLKKKKYKRINKY